MFVVGAFSRPRKTRARKNNKQETHNIICTGLSRDYPGTVSGLSQHFPEISWEFCLCVSCFPPRKRQCINKFDPHRFRDSPEKLFMFSGCFGPRKVENKESSLSFLSLFYWNSSLLSSGARGPPQFLKKRSENAGANENLSGGFAAIPGIAPRVAPRIVGFVLIKS